MQAAIRTAALGKRFGPTTPSLAPAGSLDCGTVAAMAAAGAAAALVGVLAFAPRDLVGT